MNNHLSKRELEVLKLVAVGKSGGEIAGELGIGIRTAEAHHQRVNKKLGVSVNKCVKLTRYALEQKLVSVMDFNDRALEFYGLTKREKGVVELMAEGKEDQEIGTKLSLSRRTVEAHIERIYRKIGLSASKCSPRVALTHFAVKHGLTTLADSWAYMI